MANGREQETDEAVVILASWALHTQRADEARTLVQERVQRIDDRRAGPTAARLLNELNVAT